MPEPKEVVSNSPEFVNAVELVRNRATDLNIPKEKQKLIFRTFSEYMLRKQEEKLFG